MNDLDKAIAELRRAKSEDSATADTHDAFDAILNAVRSGALIPAAERDAAVAAALERAAEDFQGRVKPWMTACFGEEVSNDRLERGDRLLEEVLELLQSGQYPAERVASLAAYVWSRPVGEPAQEVGGVMVTLAAYCLAHGIDMHEAGETELARIWTKVEKIRAKQAAKPKGSALPQEWPTTQPQASALAAVRAEARRVKPLAFDDKNVAVGLGCRYLLAKDYDGWRWFQTSLKGNLENVSTRPFREKPDVVAAAQADYEARILAALEGTA